MWCFHMLYCVSLHATTHLNLAHFFNGRNYVQYMYHFWSIATLYVVKVLVCFSKKKIIQKQKKSLYSYKNVLNEEQVWKTLLVLFYMLEHTTMESWMLRGFRFDKCFIVKTYQSLVRYSPFMFVSSWRNFNSLHRVLPTPLMLICEFSTTVCAILYSNVCFWSIKYLTNEMCNSHRKRRCVFQHGTRHHDDVCVFFFFQKSKHRLREGEPYWFLV